MNKRLATDKYLVVEQKGWRIVITGLVLAVTFSLTFKALFSPRRIQYEIERVLSGADPRFTTWVEGAHLSLSRGVWPRLAIIIDKLNVQTTDPCLNKVKAKIENLVMPIAFSSLLDRNLMFKHIEVGLLNIEMSAKKSDCHESVPAKTLESVSGIPPVSASSEDVTASVKVKSNSHSDSQDSLPPTSFSQSATHQNTASAVVPKTSTTETRSDKLVSPEGGVSANKKRSSESPPLVQTMSVESKLLKHIVFNEVHLKLEEWPQFQWNLTDFDVHLPTQDNEKIQVEGLIALTSDPTRFAFQGINAKVQASINHHFIEAKVHGAWREGRIDINGHWDSKTQDFTWSGDFKQIPWGQIIVLAKALGRTESLPVSSQAWVSTKILWRQQWNEPEHVEVSDSQIEGEFGDFILGKIIMDQAKGEAQWLIQPYTILLKEINVDLLAKMLGWEGRYPAFNKFGIFDGEAQYQENQHIELSGELTDAKMAFAGKGRPQIQNINSLKLEVRGQINHWSGVLKDIDLEGGHWNGNIEINADQESKKISLNTQFSNVEFHSDIESLLTINGSLEPIEGKLSVDFMDGQTSNLKGFLRSTHAVINDISLDQIKIDFDGGSGQLNGRLHIQEMIVPRSRLAYWPQDLPEGYENLRVKNLLGDINQSSKGIIVKDLQGTLLDFKSRFAFEAMADTKDQLQGQLQIRMDRDRKSRIFNLMGTRQAPQWRE